MYYIERLPNDIAKIHYDKPAYYDLEIEELPIGEGILMMNEDGDLYFDSDCIILKSDSLEENDSPTDHEILMTLLGVTE